jgi:hypothetical protein
LVASFTPNRTPIGTKHANADFFNRLTTSPKVNKLALLLRRRMMLGSEGAARTEESSVGDEPTADRRVRFDFEVDFSNGGGLQGQDFRLDIEGEDISSEELARYIVEDMRLLMVKEVRILNKEIITERHKRREPT